MKKLWYPKFFAWVAAIVFVLFFLPTIVRAFDKWLNTPKDHGIVVGNVWTGKIQVPIGTMVLIRSRDNVAYEVRTWNKGSYVDHLVPRDPVPDTRSLCEQFVWMKEDFSSFELRVVDKDARSAVIDVGREPYRRGGPCGEVRSE